MLSNINNSSLNRDPIGEEGGLNLYAFVGNRPLTMTDSSGLRQWINCSESQQTLIEKLERRGRETLEEELQQLRRISGHELRTEIIVSLLSAYQSDNLRNEATILFAGVMRNAQRALSLTINAMSTNLAAIDCCAEPPEDHPDADAYYRRQDHRIGLVCPAFWTRAEHTMAAIIVHEYGHAALRSAHYFDQFDTGPESGKSSSSDFLREVFTADFPQEVFSNGIRNTLTRFSSVWLIREYLHDRITQEAYNDFWLQQ